jgi:isoaspartyl peptidase/L-asparaginase-like protein (Ntn-hydrolase superfamily)
MPGMPQPIILSTWSFGMPANRAAWPSLSVGGSAIDAVEAAARVPELDPAERSVGLGGLPDASGVVTLDGCIMLSPAKSAGVACVRNYPNVVSIARKVMERTPHKLLVGEGAEAFAAACGFEKRELLTPESREAYQKWRDAPDDDARRRLFIELNRANREEQKPFEPHDTIGVLALDAHGILAGACSTSGLSFKLPGRVGDSPILGHGLYVDPKAGAATATGNGELMMGTCASFLAVERLRLGDTPAASVRHVLQRIADSYELTGKEQSALIALHPTGSWACGSLRAGFKCAVLSRDGEQLLDSQYVHLR